ncbi:MAG TPA: hypothetical protein PKD85_00055 [Saprospiraceae bacterium]|nr:hypothetical protein [Saprospiraceae bacterium]
MVHNETSNEPERQSADTQRDDFQKTLLEQNLKTSKLPGVMEERTLAERTELAAKQKAIIERYRLEHSTTTFLKSSGEHWYELLDELVGTLREREQVFIRELVEDWAPDYTRSIDADEQSTILIFFIMLGFDNLTVAEFLDLARKLEADSLLDTEVQRHGTGELILTLKEAHPVFGHNVWIDAIRKTRKYIEIQKQVLTEDTPRFEKLYLLNFLRQHRFVLQHDPELVRFLKFPTREVYGEHYPVLLNNIYKLYVRGDQGTITFPANLTITPEQ